MNFLTVKEAVVFFGGKVSASLIYRLVRSGKLPAVKLGGKVLVLADCLASASMITQEATETSETTEDPPCRPERRKGRSKRSGRVVLLNGRYQEQ